MNDCAKETKDVRLSSGFSLFKRGSKGLISLRVSLGGRQRRIPLKTADKREAEKLARDFLKRADLYGYATAVQALKSGSLGNANGKIGLKELGGLYERYRQQAYSLKQKGESSKPYYLGALKKLMACSEARYLDEIDVGVAYEAWKKRYPSQTINTFRGDVRKASALFSLAALDFYRKSGFEIENPFITAARSLPPSDIKPYEPLSDEMRAKIWKGDGLSQTQKMIVMLGMGAALRSGEIAHAKLDWVNDDGLTVQPIEGVWTPKSGLARRLKLDKSFIADLLALRGGSESPYLVPGMNDHQQPKPATRLKGEMAYAVTWLRNVGVKARKPIHVLRKEAGSLVASTDPQGLFAARDFLGHSTVAVTEKYYAHLLKRTAFDPVAAMQQVRS